MSGVISYLRLCLIVGLATLAMAVFSMVIGYRIYRLLRMRSLSASTATVNYSVHSPSKSDLGSLAGQMGQWASDPMSRN